MVGKEDTFVGASSEATTLLSSLERVVLVMCLSNETGCIRTSALDDQAARLSVVCEALAAAGMHSLPDALSTFRATPGKSSSISPTRTVNKAASTVDCHAGSKPRDRRVSARESCRLYLPEYITMPWSKASFACRW